MGESPADPQVAASSFPGREWDTGSAVGGRVAADPTRFLLVLRARGGAMSELLLDRAGRRRSPARMPGFHAGRPLHNKGLRYPADPPKV
jgi:hypothetical protein